MSWLDQHRFLDTGPYGLTSGDIYFESTRKDKVERIERLRCTHFIDDLEETFLELEDCTVDYLCTSVMSSDQDLDGLQVLGYHEERDAGAFYGITEPTLEPNAPVVRGDRYHTTACSHLLEKRSDMDPTANPCHATLLTAGSDTYVWQEDRWTPLTEQIPEIEGLYVQPNLIPFLPAVPPRVLVVPRQRSRDGDPRLTEYLSYYGPPLYLPGACLYYRKSTAKSARG